MLENPAPPSWKFSSPLTNSSMERYSHVTPSPEKQNKKIPLKMSVHFPITITICKHGSKFVTCSPSPGDCEGVNRHQDIFIRFFGYVEQNGYLKILIRWLWEKNEHGRGPRCPIIFGHLKRAPELLISVRMSPLATF